LVIENNCKHQIYYLSRGVLLGVLLGSRKYNDKINDKT